MRKLLDLFADEAGHSAIEYALVASLIAVAAIGGMKTLGNGVDNHYTTINNEIR